MKCEIKSDKALILLISSFFLSFKSNLEHQVSILLGIMIIDKFYLALLDYYRIHKNSVPQK